jgi:enediyne polyketide synthase
LERVATQQLRGFHSAPLPLETGPEIYDALLFHTGRFRRITGYRHLSAKECLAELEPDTSAEWFGRYLPGDLALGDAGARDAAIHCIQACIPHRRLLPIGVERIELGGAPCMAKMRQSISEGPTRFLLHARQRRQEEDTFTYDLDLLSCDGCILERWTGLRLRAVENIERTAAWPAALLGPWLERKVEEWIPEAGISVSVALQAGGRDRDTAPVSAIQTPWPIRHRPDGKPEAAGGKTVSASHGAGLTLSVAGAGPLACDLEPIAARGSAVWQDLLGAERFRLAELAAAEAHETLDPAATRIWAAAECLKKAGAVVDAPLVLEACKPDGWVLLTAGAWIIATSIPLVQSREGPAPLAIAVLAARSSSRP